MSSTLVTGATGLIGAATVERLVGAGRTVQALVRDPSAAHRLRALEVDIVTGDVTDPDRVALAMRGCDVVYHAAGAPPQWARDPRRFDYVNAGGTRVVVDAALRAGVRSFVHTSTVEVFTWTPEVPFDESAPLAVGATAYTRSMVAADDIVTRASHRGLRARIAHPARTYGAAHHARHGTNRLLADLLHRRLRFLPPGGLPLVHADDVAEGLLALEDAPVGTRLNLSDAHYDLHTIASAINAQSPAATVPPMSSAFGARSVARRERTLARLTRRRPTTTTDELHFLGSACRPDTTRARDVFGWSPRDLAAGLEITLPSLREAGSPFVDRRRP